MFGAIKALPEMIKNWLDHRDLLYQLVAGFSAALVVISVAAGIRPSDSLTAVAHGLGLTPVAGWFSTNAPPVLAVSVPLVQSIALSGVLVFLAKMVFVPLWYSRDDDNQMFAYEPLRLLGAPAAATIWVLLLIAAQQSNITPVLQQWEHLALWGGAWTMGALIATSLLYIAASHYGFDNRAKLLL